MLSPIIILVEPQLGENIGSACRAMLNFNVNIHSNLFNKDFPELANDMQVKFVDNQDNFTELEWNSLYKLAEDTFVEESESLKQGGAGAGLTDND